VIDSFPRSKMSIIAEELGMVIFQAVPEGLQLSCKKTYGDVTIVKHDPDVPE